MISISDPQAIEPGLFGMAGDIRVVDTQDLAANISDLNTEEEILQFVNEILFKGGWQRTVPLLLGGLKRLFEAHIEEGDPRLATAAAMLHDHLLLTARAAKEYLEREGADGK